MKFDSNIPLPPPQGGVHRDGRHRGYQRYGFADMEVGQSFLLRKPAGKTYEELRSRVTSALTNFRKHAAPADRKKQFATRIMDKEKGIRVWRVK